MTRPLESRAATLFSHGALLLASALAACSTVFPEAGSSTSVSSSSVDAAGAIAGADVGNTAADTSATTPECYGYQASLDPSSLVGGGPVFEAVLLDVVRVTTEGSYAVGWFAHGAGLSALAINRDDKGKLLEAHVLGKDSKQIAKFHAVAPGAGGGVWLAGSWLKSGAQLPSPMLARIVDGKIEQAFLSQSAGEFGALVATTDGLIGAGIIAEKVGGALFGQLWRISVDPEPKPTQQNTVYTATKTAGAVLSGITSDASHAVYSYKGQGMIVQIPSIWATRSLAYSKPEPGQLRAVGRPGTGSGIVAVGNVTTSVGTTGRVTFASANLKTVETFTPGRSSKDALEDFVGLSDKRIIAVGRTLSDDGKHWEGWFVRGGRDTAGFIEHGRVYGGDNHHELRAIAVGKAGLFLVAGGRTVANTRYAWQLQVNSNGDYTCN